MLQDRMQQAYELFEQALQRLPEERSAFLIKACRDDHELRAEVESLLEHDSRVAEDFLRPPDAGPTFTRLAFAERPDALVGSRIGSFHIKRVIASGGMGTVYEAVQDHPRRTVALKIIKLGMDTREVVARFESERQALAVMSHPNIAKVFDAGATEQGRPYFVMEHVSGVPVTEHCDRHKLHVGERLALFMEICDAVQHAHQKGIIHRDLKPSNILVAYEGSQAVPKIIDFGVAKALNQRFSERTIFTEQGQLIGTPEYMSPEQAEMSGQDIDTRADVYSLGVLLYELLTGTLPFDPKTLRRAAFAEVQRIIRDDEPPKPSTRLSHLGDASSTSAKNRRVDPRSLERELRGDLDWIVMKALEKDRARRYDTAIGLAADIRRHLNHEPVLAGPPSVAYRMSKFVRRHRAGAIAALIVAAALLVATAVSINFALNAEEARGRAIVNLRMARQREREANDARKNEAEARALAQQREAEANKARAAAQRRADELKILTEFQQSMLSEIDAWDMGKGIINDLRGQIRERMTRESASPEEIETALKSFDELAVKINATNVARDVVDEHVLARATETIREEFADQPTIRAALQQTVASVYWKIGLYRRSMPLTEAALKTRRELLTNDHPDMLSSINSMGVLLWVMGRTAEAMPYLTEALEGRRRVLGNDHPDTLISISNMGGVLLAQGKYEQAEPYCCEALERKRRVLGDDHLDTIDSIGNMGALLHYMGRQDEAKRFLTEALQASRRILGNDHPRTLQRISNLGALYESMDNFDAAEACLREALEGRRRVLGNNHPATLITIDNMGCLLRQMGRYEEAERHHREALECKGRVLGGDHPDTLTSVNNLAYLLKTMGRYEEAEPYSREALENRQHVLGDDHPHTLLSLHNRAELLIATERFTEAESLALESYDRHINRYGRGHAKTSDAINLLVNLYDAWHEAEPAAGYDTKTDEWHAKLEQSHAGTEPATGP
jgi:serine/threonine protein kinase/tetratricopeptide (TPR) repeat protein